MVVAAVQLQTGLRQSALASLIALEGSPVTHRFSFWFSGSRRQAVLALCGLGLGLALARKLVKFPEALQLATGQLRPHFLCLYLYELAGDFSSFYTADKVAVEDTAVRARRLLLVV